MSAPEFDAAAEYRTGVEALQAGQYAKAKKAFGRVLGMSPRDANTNYLAGLAAAGLDDLKSARKFYERAVKSNARLIPAQQELGIVYAKIGDLVKVEAKLVDLHALATKCAQSCAEAADITRAIDAIIAAKAAGPQARLDSRPDILFTNEKSGDSAYLHAVGLINEARYEAAIASLQAARATFGPHPDVMTYLGFANRKLGRFDVAEFYYKEALALAPRHRGATEYFGELMVERGDLAGAKTMLARLEDECDFGCAQADELGRWIKAGRSPAS